MKSNRSKEFNPAAFAALIISLVLCEPAFATPGQTALTNIQTWLTGIGLTVITIAVMVAGFKVLFQHARLSEVSNILIGGIMIGSASLIAGMVMAG